MGQDSPQFSLRDGRSAEEPDRGPKNEVGPVGDQ